MKALVLHVKKVYFEEIRDGHKMFEYRERTAYWSKRLRGREYNGVVVCCGYPKAGNASRILYRRWNGYMEQTIIHEHFGWRPTPVFSIDVSAEDFEERK